jgi:hypothetical protein
MAGLSHMNESVDLADEIIAAWNAPKDGHPRTYALMGPNGAGKSRQLITIRDSLAKRGVPAFLLPPQRQMAQIAATSGYHRGALVLRGSTVEENWNEIIKWIFSPQQQHLQQSGSGVAFSLILGALFDHIASTTRTVNATQMRALWEWHEHQTRSEPPRLSPSEPLRSLERKLGEILDYEVKISVPAPTSPSSAAEISFRRSDGTPFLVSGLSSGEQQILLISTFLLGSTADRFVFLVDEPELYLNEALASRIWERFEAAFPNAVFLYATHSPTFATRPTIAETYVIGMDGAVEKIDKTVPVPSVVLREIVGTRVQLLRSDACPIFCEDELSKMILKDLFVGQNVLPISLNGWESVVAAVKREGAWERNLRSANPAFCGVIDRDTWSNDEIEGLKAANVFCLPRYDAESLLLDPAIALWSLSTSTGRSIHRDDWTSILVTAATRCRSQTLRDLGKHVQHRQDHILEFDETDHGIRNVRVQPSAALKKTFEDRAEALYAAIAHQDADAILTLFKGKALYKATVSQVLDIYKVRIGTAIQRYREMRTSDDFRSIMRGIPWVSAFRSALEKHLCT